MADLPETVPVACPTCDLSVPLDWAVAPVAHTLPGWQFYVAGRLDLTELEAHLLTHRQPLQLPSQREHQEPPC